MKKEQIVNLYKYIDSYCLSTGINCIYTDKTGTTIYTGCDSNYEQKFCKYVNKNDSLHECCRKSHLYGALESKRFGGQYIYYCYTGLVHWVSPIIINGNLHGSLTAGPVLMLDPEESLIYENTYDFPLSLSSEMTKSLLEKVTRISPKKVSALSNLLYILACNFSDSSFSEMAKKEKQLKLQADIATNIQSLKKKYSNADISSYPFEKEKKLISHIAFGEIELARKTLNEILGHIYFSSGNDLHVIKAKALELIVVLSRAAIEGGADNNSIFGLNFKYIQEINNIDNINYLTNWLNEILKAFTDKVLALSDIKHVDIIYKTREFVNNNYMNKICLDDAAKNVYLSPSYFSKILNNEMKINFNSYLNSIRIEKAKTLLSNTNTSLLVLAQSVGFEDQSYFSKVFKKITGVSPGSYRKRNISR